MAYQGFGISSGPTFRPNSQPTFGSFTRPPSPSPPPPLSSPQPPSPPPPPPPPQPQLSPVSPYVPPRRSPPRRAETPQRMRSPPVANQSFRPVMNPPYSSAGTYRPSDPRWDNEQNALLNYSNAQSFQRPSAVSPFSRNFRPSVPAKIPQAQELKRSRSPGNNSRNISQDVNGSRLNSVNDCSELVPQRTRSPPLGNNHTVEVLRPHLGEIQGPVLSSPAWVSRPRLPCDYSDLLTPQELSPISPFADPYETQKNYPTQHADVQPLKRTRPPPLPSANEVHKENSHLARNVIKRPSMSPPVTVTRSNAPFHTTASEMYQSFPPSMHNGDAEANDTKPTSPPAPKRTRSPPVPSAAQFFQGSSNSTIDETEREIQAKAKRLARFRVELSQTMPSSSDIVNQNVSGNRHDHPMAERGKSVAEYSKETVGDFPSGSTLSENEGLESSSIIIGLCPDMCPESERAERERKGDLDHYERLDGDRNQTRKSLAVKKYNRTAEREANLIRPMPILLKTIDYLLNLLDQPYDDRFLGMYNFLWDRMRAIRMDLRMQHIFNLGAIAMLEQMIRLHIIAMHELCEYTKGEGFSEGFDAHLNIEQMNKTSVELFQMYDDHRKKGINVPTEKEFRGYYALLKLDKHPGYKVEPAELSLDLAKMTPEIRQTPEVLFARDVARACRTGNFIAFFRLARRASYLQACLMHAHFAKLRTQALASLHSGLQNNQGLPIASVAKWLGMEVEDIESLSDYHGFLLKEFEEPYMVKEGPFLNSEKDYPTNCSKLVHLKRSRRISEDVSSSGQVVSLPAVEKRKIQLPKVYKHDPPAVQIVETASPTFVSDEDMPDSLALSSPKDGTPVPPVFAPSIFDQRSGDDHQMASVGFPTWNIFPTRISPQSQPAKVGRVEKQNAETLIERPPDRSSDTKAMPLPISPARLLQELSPASKFDFATETVPQNVVVKHLEGSKPEDTHQETEPDKAIEYYHEKEAAEAKLKLILRIWRRRSSMLKELREQRLLAANAALNSLSLGPPIRQKRDEPSTFGEFNIDRVMRERYKKHERSWSRLNVSDVVVDQLSKRNPEARCLCFKIIVCSQVNDADGDNLVHRSEDAHMAASSWLHSKLMPVRKDDVDNDLVKSLPGLSIWKKWLLGQSSTDLTCCLSVIKDVKFGDLNETVLGASAVLFLVSESISWELQKIRLQNLLMSLPSNSRLPLLILSDSYNEYLTSGTILDRLGLSNIDNSRISRVLVLLLVEDLQVGPLDGFFSDERLREGLQWLASESPLQPVLNHVKTRELIMTRLNSSLRVFDKMSAYEVAPDHCISALNEALDQSLLEVTEAVSFNPSNWPCPEITLLEDSSAELRASKLYLPSIGWSSAATVEPLVCAFRECKLPAFSDDISWLGRGCSVGEEIENQRLQLENCLIKYLAELSKIMGSALATNEARVMLQKNARLELHNSSFYIVPQWVMIFRRIFNWRLMNLSSGDLSSAYVCERRSGVPTTSEGLDNLKHEISLSSPYHLMHPSLDEMVEAGCSPLLSRRGLPEPDRRRHPPKMVSKTNTSELVVNERNLRQQDGLNTADDGLYSGSGLNNSCESTVATTAKKEGDKLSKLLENCNILQNMIEKKLSIYF